VREFSRYVCPLGLGLEICDVSALQAQNKITGQSRQILFEGLPPQTQDLHGFFSRQQETLLSKSTIGILAGMGPRSTGPFLDLVITACQQKYGARHDIDFPKMLICSQPAPFYEDRPIDHAALEAATLEGLLHLQSAGADFLAIACNTVHIYYPRLAAAVTVPLLNIVELAVAAIPRSKQNVAVVAARPTIASGIFQSALEAANFNLIDPNWQADVDAMLSAVREATDPEKFKRLWESLLTKAQGSGADAVLLACLDLSGIVCFASTQLVIIDAANCLAISVVETWLAQNPKN